MDKKWNIKKIGKKQWLLVLLAGILLVVITLPTKEPEENDSNAENTGKVLTEGVSEERWEKYKEDVEAQLEEVLGQVEGVGSVKVMVTLAGTGEMVVEKDTPQTQSQTEETDSNGGNRNSRENSWEETTVYVQENGSSVPYVVKELVPDIEGVCVIAQGGGNGTVAQNISEAVQALFPIEIHKIKVMKMKS